MLLASSAISARKREMCSQSHTQLVAWWMVAMAAPFCSEHCSHWIARFAVTGDDAVWLLFSFSVLKELLNVRECLVNARELSAFLSSCSLAVLSVYRTYGCWTQPRGGLRECVDPVEQCWCSMFASNDSTAVNRTTQLASTCSLRQ